MRLLPLLAVLLASAATPLRAAAPDPRPNILWITCEDISPLLGCYGETHAQTPNLDRLAASGIRFTQAYANAPVCAVARATLLTGIDSATLGTHHMRCRTTLPSSIPATPKLLRQAGYHTTNNAKKDYNSPFESDPSLWNESSRRAHWRQAPAGKPFFAVFNLDTTHESKLDPQHIAQLAKQGEIPPQPRLNPASLPLPPFHPDLPAIRTDWARFHDLITRMDRQAGQILSQLAHDGLAENTIVFFFSDHGGMLAGTKRFIHASGTRVPLLIHLPKRWQHLSPLPPGSVDDSLVSFADLPATVLALAGIERPAAMQGRVLLGPHAGPARKTVHFTRDRMTERPDFSRAISDGRHHLSRHFMPHRPPGRCTRYGPTVQQNWRAWENHFDQGRCDPLQSAFYQPKPPLELHDLSSDPWQVRNLADDPALAATREKLSAALDRHMLEIRDLGLIPEAMFHQLAGPGLPHATLHDYGREDASYPLARILAAAKAASTRQAQAADLAAWLADPHPILRHWAAYALFLAPEQLATHQETLSRMATQDPMAANRIAAATALAAAGGTAADLAYESLLREAAAPGDGYVLLYSLNALQITGLDARLQRSHWQAFRQTANQPKPATDPTGYDITKRLIEDALTLFPQRRIVR